MDTKKEVPSFLLDLIKESKAAKGKAPKPVATTKALSLPQHQPLWHLEPEVKLQITSLHCLSCGSLFETPGYIMLKYTSKAVTRWKHLEGGDLLPQAPVKLVEREQRDILYCSNCFALAKLEAPKAPVQRELPLELAEMMLDTVFQKFDTAEEADE